MGYAFARPNAEMTWITTASVLANLRDYENRDAWSSFADRFRQPVVSFARTMGLAPMDAEDVAQETLLAFAQAFREERYDPAKGRLSRFLFGIAYRQSLKFRRVAGHPGPAGVNIAHGGTEFWSEIPDEETASGIWDTEWEQQLLDRCMTQAKAEFEPETFRAFELSVRDERPPADVASMLGITIKSVYNAKHRVLKRIRELRETLDAGV
jgi:RNA polymerase sigma-70 factor (ECF subfamily)